MSIHLLDTEDLSMCGRRLKPASLTRLVAEVTCRRCRGSQAYRAAMAEVRR
jgi:hypothetical protein